MSTIRKLTIPLLGLSGLLACDRLAGDRRVAGVVARDSAGTEIVEIPESVAEPVAEWRLSPDPALVIGKADGPAPEVLFRVFSVARLADRAIAVANGGTQEVRLYDSAGHYLHTIGRAGGGPGEFRQLFDLVRLSGDTLAVWDIQLARLSLFSSSGEFIRSTSPRPAPGLFPRLHGVLADGSFLLASGVDPTAFLDGGPGVRRDTVAYLLYSRDGVLEDTIGRFPGTEQYVRVETGEGDVGFSSIDLPFGRETFMVTGADRIYVGTGDRYEISVLTPSGKLERLIRRPGRGNRPLTRQAIAAYEARVAASSAEGDAVEAGRAPAVAYPQTLPAHGDLVIGRDGNLWVRDAAAATDSAVAWSAFDTQGRLVATLRTPRDLIVHEIGTDYVLGVTIDELGVERVLLHGILPEEPGGM